ncbi:MAG TPA: cytochrome-c oxidase, cbb3-type subunit III [Gammaproteobacteria bacterium]
MSGFWHGFIIIFTLANIAACLWLLFWTARKRRGEKEEKTTGHVWDENLTELNNPLPRWWLWLFVGTVVFSVVYLVLYPGLGNFEGTLAWSQTEQYQQEKQKIDALAAHAYARFVGMTSEQLAADADALQYGQRLFINNCSVCHGSDAGGARGFPSLRDKDWLWGGTADNIRVSIAEGRTGVMPAWGAALGEEGVEEVASYILTLSGHRYRVAAESRGKQKYAMFCTGCHGQEGKGNILLGVPNLTDNIWLHGFDTATVKSVIRDGRTNIMPAHKELLTDMQISLLTAYIGSLTNEQAANH